MTDLLKLSDDIFTEMKAVQRDDSSRVILCRAKVEPTSDLMFYNCGIYISPPENLVGKMPSEELFPARLPVMSEEGRIDIHAALNHTHFKLEGSVEKGTLKDYLDIRDRYVNFLLQFARRSVMFAFENDYFEDPRSLFSSDTFFNHYILTNHPQPPASLAGKHFYTPRVNLENQLELSQAARKKLKLNSK